jgi:serine protease Do
MRTSVWFGVATLAASLLGANAMAQTATPRARAVAAVAAGPSYLGIGGKDIVDADRAKSLNLKDVRGVEVTNVVEDSPAAKAGFKEGDVVWEYNGQPVEGWVQLTRLIQETPAGRQVKIVVMRNGSPQTLTPTVEARKGGMVIEPRTFVMPEIPRMPEITIPPMDIPRFQQLYRSPMLGIEGESLNQEEQFAEFLGVKDGVLVKSVMKDSAAEKAGIKAGDVIVKVDDTKVSSTREITSALRGARGKKTVTVTVVRNKHEMPLTVTIEAAGGGTPGVRAGVFIGPDFEALGGPFAVTIATRPMTIRMALPQIYLKLAAQRGVI